MNTIIIDGGNKNQLADLPNQLTYISYSSNRDRGMTHKQLLTIGIGDDAMKAKYETDSKNNKIK